MSCLRRLLTDFSFGAAIAGDAERLRESDREKSEDPPSWFSMSKPLRAGLRSGDDGIEPPCANVRHALPSELAHIPNYFSAVAVAARRLSCHCPNHLLRSTTFSSSVVVQKMVRRLRRQNHRPSRPLLQPRAFLPARSTLSVLPVAPPQCRRHQTQ